MIQKTNSKQMPFLTTYAEGKGKFMSYTVSNSVWCLLQKQNHDQYPIYVTLDSLT
jgi:hypothetical protein